VVRHVALRRAPAERADADASPGTLFASGLVAGGALAGLAVALLSGLEAEEIGPDGVARPVSLIAHWGLALAPRLLGEDAAAALTASAAWTVAPILALAALLAWIAARGARKS